MELDRNTDQGRHASCRLQKPGQLRQDIPQARVSSTRIATLAYRTAQPAQAATSKSRFDRTIHAWYSPPTIPRMRACPIQYRISSLNNEVSTLLHAQRHTLPVHGTAQTSVQTHGADGHNADLCGLVPAVTS
ncbi:hypothetical protein C2E23DRAFT_500295 [Lenzites betulinus]|nr:hypothetical protein C2E23DRAFT_500295 [Lenzites betulinus]